MSTQEGGAEPADVLTEADSQGAPAAPAPVPTRFLPNPFGFGNGSSNSNGLPGDFAATARTCLERLGVSADSVAGHEPGVQARARAEALSVAARVVAACPPGMLNSPYDVYHGEAGLALLFLRAQAWDPVLEVAGTSCLVLARRYVQSALAKVSTRLRKHMEQGRRSYHCGFLDSPAGVYAVAAAVFHHAGMHDDAEDALDALVAMKQICFSTSASGDLLYGRPGYLYSLIFVRRHAGALGRARVPEALVAAVHAAVLQDGRRGAQRTYTLPVGRDRVSTRMPTPPAAGPLVWSWHAERYVGAAHGIAGSLGALLAVPRLLDVGSDASARTDADAGSSSGGDGTGAAAATLADVDAALAALASRRTANGNVPVRVDETLATSRQLYADSELVQFCHGAPGAAACLARAHEALGGRPALLDAAASAADLVWERGLLRKGVGLCHGIAGNAYAFLAVYRATGDARQFDRACKFFALALDFDRLPSLLDVGGTQAVAGAPRDDAGNVSLFQGLAGLALLGFEIGYWGQSKDGVAQGWVQGGFPCFTDVCE